MRIETRLLALERRRPARPSEVCTLWILREGRDTTSPGGQHAQAVCERMPIQIVWLREDDHPRFYPEAPCWCGATHETPF